MTIRDIAGLHVFDDTLEAATLTGAQPRDYLEYPARYFAQVPATGAVDVGTITGAGGTPDHHYDVLSGVDYDLDVSRPAAARVTRPEFENAAVAADDVFVVAVNDSRRSGGGDFPHVSTAPKVHDEQLEIRQLLIDRASATGVIDPADFADTAGSSSGTASRCSRGPALPLHPTAPPGPSGGAVGVPDPSPGVSRSVGVPWSTDGRRRGRGPQ